MRHDDCSHSPPLKSNRGPSFRGFGETKLAANRWIAIENAEVLLNVDLRTRCGSIVEQSPLTNHSHYRRRPSVFRDGQSRMNKTPTRISKENNWTSFIFNCMIPCLLAGIGQFQVTARGTEEGNTIEDSGFTRLLSVKIRFALFSLHFRGSKDYRALPMGWWTTMGF